MPHQTLKGKTAVGFFVDGLQLKYVQLSLMSGKVILRDFKTVSLETKLEKKPLPLKADGAPSGAGDESAFGVADAIAAATEEAPTEMSTNATILLSLLEGLPPKDYTVSIALCEPAVRYHEFDSDFGLNGLKLKKKVAEELAATGAESPTLDALGVIKTATGRLLSIVRQGSLQLFDLLTEIRSSLNGIMPRIKLVHSADLALLEIVRSSYELQEESVTVLAYVGYDFSRVIFMQGNNYLHFAPLISEGYHAANIENTIYSRIRLELENNGLRRIDRILLAGESHKAKLLDAMGPEFPQAKIEYLGVSGIEKPPSSSPVDNVVSEYAIPLAVAWRALQPNLKGAYNVDLVPASIIQNQKAFAWHGWLTAALMAVSILYFSLSIVPRSGTIRTAREGLSQKQDDLSALQVYKSRKGTFEADIDKYEKAMKVYNSIAEGSGRWTRILDFLSKNVGSINSIWIQGVRPVQGNPGAFDISGRAYVLSRISALVNVFEKASLLQLKTVTVRNQDVYEFDIRVEKIDKEDAPYVPDQATKR